MRVRPYLINDQKALQAAHPHLFKMVPDHTKIRKALSAGFSLPGVELTLTPQEESIAANQAAASSEPPDFLKT